MTNYEWLVKNDKLGAFIYDIKFLDGHALMSKYQMKFPYEDLTFNRIADWLRAERKTKKYVECKKVADIISLTPFRMPFDQKKFSKEEVQQLFTGYRIDLLSAIGKLITKEIDE